MQMKSLLKLKKYTLLVAVVFFTSAFLTSCDDEETGPTQNLLEIVQNDEELGIFAGIITADLEAELAKDGDHTVFVPSNAAMTQLLKTLFGNAATDTALFRTISPGVISSVLKYHISTTKYGSSDLANGTEITTLQGEKIKVVTTSTGEKKLDTGATSDAAIVTADISATNGVIHVIDVVIIPPTLGAQLIQTLGKMAQPILLGASFSTLAAAIAKADAGKAPAETIAGALVGLTAGTVFAPANQVFQAGGITVDTYTAAQWDAIIRGHLIPLQSLTTLEAGTKTTVNGKTITIAVTANGTAVLGSANTAAVGVSTANKQVTTNGVVYPIGGVILHN
jgi:transforming growth factor-beta-induced protein